MLLTLILMSIAALLSFYRYLHWKIISVAYIAWLAEHDYQQPSKQDLARLAGQCAENYVRDLFKR